MLLVGLQIHVGGRKVGERARRAQALHSSRQLGRHLRQKLERLQRLALEVQEARFHLGRLRLLVRNALHARDQERPAGEELERLEALVPLGDEVVRAIGRGDIAHDIGNGAHAVQVDGQRIGDLTVALHQEPDLPLLAHGVLGSRDRALTPDRHRHDDAGEQRDVAHRDDGDRIGGQRRQGRGLPLAR